MRNAPEQNFQIAVAQYLDLVLEAGTEWTAVNPLPGKAGKAIGGLRKAMGLKAGWPDIQIVREGRIYLIELKDMSGTFKPSQREMFPRLRGAGCPVATCRSLSEVDLALDAFHIPHKRIQYLRAA